MCDLNSLMQYIFSKIQYMQKQSEPKIQLANDVKWEIIKNDPYLKSFEHYFTKIHDLANSRLSDFKGEGGLNGISKSYQRYGVHREGNKFIYRQWAPQALSVGIFGQFNQWKRGQYQCIKNPFGLWECQIDKNIKQLSSLKAQVQLKDGSWADRVPAWINFTRQKEDHSFEGVYVNLNNYEWKNDRPKWEKSQSLRIYECHIGMAGVQERVHTFNEFREKVLPRAAKLGYNVVQLMAVIQHPYYGSFGYHCSSFFSVSSRFGTPAQFKQLVDTAHGLGIKIVIDLVHSHAAKNVDEGINMWDGSDYQYFHGGDKGNHPLWDSRVFDYSKYEVLRFLLSNIRFWLEEYKADGFRFDGVTSMLYHHHGSGVGFTGNYEEYFNDQLDVDALAYLVLATTLAKTLVEDVILIAEDVSGFPGLCRPADEGGIGFNYRLAMALPDMWIKLLKEKRDEDWKVGEISYQLTNRRANERCITYAESHDQALVGDKTISMWLFDAEIYSGMSCLQPQSLKVFRGMALHKLIRLLSFSLGGEGYLCFMGNEFGHPEWIDFPRQGNNWSYHYCIRRWDLAQRTDLRYHHLEKFDVHMLGLDIKYKILSDKFQYVRTVQQDHQILVYQKGPLLFVLNFHPTQSYNDYQIYCSRSKSAKVFLSTDDLDCGGHGRVHHIEYEMSEHDPFVSCFKLYIPSRSGIVLLRNN